MKKFIAILLFCETVFAMNPLHRVPENTPNSNILNLMFYDIYMRLGKATSTSGTAPLDLSKYALINHKHWLRDIKAEQNWDDAGQRDDDGQGQVDDLYNYKFSRIASHDQRFRDCDGTANFAMNTRAVTIGATAGGGWIDLYGSIGGKASRILRVTDISFDGACGNASALLHGISSRHEDDVWGQAIKVNSYGDITLVLDADDSSSTGTQEYDWFKIRGFDQTPGDIKDIFSIATSNIDAASSRVKWTNTAQLNANLTIGGVVYGKRARVSVSDGDTSLGGYLRVSGLTSIYDSNDLVFEDTAAGVGSIKKVGEITFNKGGGSSSSDFSIGAYDDYLTPHNHLRLSSIGNITNIIGAIWSPAIKYFKVQGSTASDVGQPGGFKEDLFWIRKPTDGSNAEAYFKYNLGVGTIPVTDTRLLVVSTGTYPNYITRLSSGIGTGQDIFTAETNGNVWAKDFTCDSGTVPYSTTSGTATYALNASTANYAVNAGTSAWSADSGTATYLTQSDYSISVDTAEYSLTSATATYSITAGTAIYWPGSANINYDNYVSTTGDEINGNINFVTTKTTFSLTINNIRYLTSLGSNNFLGKFAGNLTATGFGNDFIGSGAGGNLTSGKYNIGMGGYALQGITAGRHNIGIGVNAFYSFESAFSKVGIGTQVGGSPFWEPGLEISSNVYVGYKSGGISTGSANVFIGFMSGAQEKGGNKLYIENSDSSSPLIYGEFDNDLIRVNGDFYATGKSSATEFYGDGSNLTGIGDLTYAILDTIVTHNGDVVCHSGDVVWKK